MSTVAAEQKTRVLPDIDKELVEDLESAIACQFGGCVRPPADDCPDPASFIVVFKSKCGHGKTIRSRTPLVCGVHASWFAAGKYMCGGCGCDVSEVPESWRHIIIEFREL